MAVITDLEGLSSAEEIFGYLDVPFDPNVLRVLRLHILKLMGNLLKHELPLASSEDEASTRARYRAHLKRAYDELSRSGPLEQRLFKVHKDAVAERSSAGRGAFVPLSSLTPQRKIS